jgi:hypothetical protein
MVGTKYSIEGNQKQAEQEGLKALAIQKAIGYPAFNRLSTRWWLKMIIATSISFQLFKR